MPLRIPDCRQGVIAQVVSRESPLQDIVSVKVLWRTEIRSNGEAVREVTLDRLHQISLNFTRQQNHQNCCPAGQARPNRCLPVRCGE